MCVQTLSHSRASFASFEVLICRVLSPCDCVKDCRLFTISPRTFFNLCSHLQCLVGTEPERTLVWTVWCRAGLISDLKESQTGFFQTDHVGLVY